ncbi:hypothetical protein Cgig2_023681 [Carnegiea gigantea]|uniref:Uncharacterized protein n=1 Tax=Carnegiea gigantea TaxID=171969 RepID=A0A9Q1KKS4_9CARY|nr:hypothetical protein Cgig2_023681 [Carnegiea gigantea]
MSGGLTSLTVGLGRGLGGLGSATIVGLFDEKVVVYSLRDDRWRSAVGGKETIGEYPGHLVCNDHGVLANNCLHWIQCDDQNCNHVIVFNIHHEKWSKLPLPNKMDEFFSRLGSFDSCSSLYRVRSDSTNEGMIKHELGGTAAGRGGGRARVARAKSKASNQSFIQHIGEL